MEPVIIPIVPTVRTVPARLDHFAGTPATYRVSESALYPIAGADQLVIEVRAGRTDFTDPRAATVLATPTGAGPWDLDLTTAQWNQPLYEAASKDYWIVIYTTTGTALQVLYTATVHLAWHNASLLAPSPPNAALALNKAQADLLYASISGTIPTATALATARTIALTGDVAYTSPAFNGTSNVTAAATLASTGVTASTYGSTSGVPVIAVDAKGRITGATMVGYSASNLTGATLASGITASSLTSAAGGTFASGAFTTAKPTQSFVFQYDTNDAGVAVSAGVATFTPPAGWVSCHYKLIQGGAGGGSGRCGAAGSIRLGGTGGIGGLRSDGVLLASQVPAGSWTVTVGVGGPGGLGTNGAVAANGNNGGNGGATSIAQGSTVLASAAYAFNGAASANVGVGVGGDGSASRAGTTSTGSGTPMWFSPPSGAVTSLANAAANYFSPQGGTSGPGGGSVNATEFVYGPGTGNGGAQTGGVASNSAGGAAPTGTATGWGTGGAGAGGGTVGSAGAAGGNGTGGVAILVFSF